MNIFKNGMFKKTGLVIGFLFLYTVMLHAQTDIIGFDSDKWTLQRGSKVVDYLGRKSLRGTATLKDVEFENGIIEVDVAFNGTRCFGGINFRMQSETNFEHFYLRPHKSKFPDALQYTPVFNGISSWQLYNGTGFTAVAEIPYNQVIV